MRTAFKIIAGFLALILLLALALIGYLTFFVNLNDYKSQISAKVASATGRQLNIAGDIKWSVFPWLGLQINQASLSNAPGFGTQPFAQIQQAGVKVKLLPLLHGEINMGRIKLDGFQLNLQKNAQGVNNWQDMLEHHEQKQKNAASLNHKQESANAIDAKNNESAKDSAPATTSANAKDLKFSIDGVDISHCTLSWQDQQQNQSFKLTDLNLKLDSLTEAKAFLLNMQFKIDSNRPALHGNFKLSSNITSADKGLFALQNLKFDSTLYDKAYQNGALHFNIAGDAQLTGKSLAFTNFHAQLDETQINGKLAITDIAKKAITFDLAMDQLNLDRYRATKSAEVEQRQDSANKASNTTHLNQQALLPIDTLRKLNLQGRLKIAKLHLNKVDASAVIMQVRALNGLINLAPLNAEVYAGNYNGSIVLDVRAKSPLITTDNRLSNIQIEPLTRDLINITKVQMTGTGNFNVHLTTQGNTETTIMQSLNGNGRLAINRGILKGVNIPYFVRVGRALINHSPPPKLEANQTDFGNLSSTFIIVNGTVKNNDLLIAAPTFQAKGSGSADLVKQFMDYKLLVQLLVTGTQEPQGDAIPVILHGRFADVSIRPDINAIAAQAAQKQLGKRVTSELQKHLGDEQGKAVGEAVNSFLQQLAH